MMTRRIRPNGTTMKSKLIPLEIGSDIAPPKRKTSPPAPTASATPRGYVKVLGTGHASNGARFIRVKVNGKRILIPTNDLLGSMIPVYARLQNHGAALADPAVQKDLWGRILAALEKEDTFPVATRLGWFQETDAQGGKGRWIFVLPTGVLPQKKTPAEIHLDEPDNDAYQRLQTKGEIKDAMQWLKLAEGNRFAMFGLALACLGPVGSFLGLEHVGIALIGGPGELKTTLASMIGSFYGGDNDPINQLASGASLRQTDFNCEKLCVGRSGLVLVLNEADSIDGKDRRAKDNAIFNLIKDVAEGRAKGRGIDPKLALWYAPSVITSNESIVAVHKRIGRAGDLSYIDRMFDMVLARGMACFFENLHGSKTPTAFRERLVALLRAYYGTPGWEFIRRLATWIEKDEKRFRAFVIARQKAYLRAARKINAPGRDARLFNKHASVYAAGCVGIELGILPFTRAGLLAAILNCQRGHVDFVARELGLTTTTVKALQTDPHGPRIRRLGTYLGRSFSKMVNVGSIGARVTHNRVRDVCPGYRGNCDGRKEMWLPFDTLRRELGIMGRPELRGFLAELLRRGLIWADVGPSGRKEFSVKRDIPSVGRKRVVALLYAPKGKL
jgi:hypothetical protein